MRKKRNKKSLSTIVSEAIILSIILSWMTILSTIPENMNIKEDNDTPVLIPYYCDKNSVILKTQSPGELNRIGDEFNFYIISPLNTEIKKDEQIYVEKNYILLLNSTKNIETYVLESGNKFILIDANECQVIINGW